MPESQKPGRRGSGRRQHPADFSAADPPLALKLLPLPPDRGQLAQGIALGSQRNPTLPAQRQPDGLKQIKGQMSRQIPPEPATRHVFDIG